MLSNRGGILSDYSQTSEYSKAYKNTCLVIAHISIVHVYCSDMLVNNLPTQNLQCCIVLRLPLLPKYSIDVLVMSVNIYTVYIGKWPVLGSITVVTYNTSEYQLELHHFNSSITLMAIDGLWLCDCTLASGCSLQEW